MNNGTYTAPSRQVAKMVTTRSTLLPINVATRSPRRTPAARKACAERWDAVASSPNVMDTDPPSPTTVNAMRWAGWRSQSNHATSACASENCSRSSSTRCREFIRSPSGYILTYNSTH
ncbi:AMP-binding enzyme domain protein [Mycobacterium kansasii]|uniref:AMP-binding enzyme domain protein n=1 Tax=Mycobacterium kansasii TaxID=1768 RepID=A0A1V3X5T8_MYCKA|nr:AMP-binding enzyme domain protein [Mycobacterium kansasii]